MSKRFIYEVWYDGRKVGLVRSNIKNIDTDMKRLVVGSTQEPTGMLHGVVIDDDLISAHCDANQAQYAHLVR